nr:unnamed protein product [Digitaria exilis]
MTLPAPLRAPLILQRKIDCTLELPFPYRARAAPSPSVLNSPLFSPTIRRSWVLHSSSCSCYCSSFLSRIESWWWASAPWPAGLEERLAAAAADRVWRGEMAWGPRAADDNRREGPTAGTRGGLWGHFGSPNLDCARRCPKSCICSSVLRR